MWLSANFPPRNFNSTSVAKFTFEWAKQTPLTFLFFIHLTNLIYHASHSHWYFPVFLLLIKIPLWGSGNPFKSHAGPKVPDESTFLLTLLWAKFYEVQWTRHQIPSLLYQVPLETSVIPLLSSSPWYSWGFQLVKPRVSNASYESV